MLLISQAKTSESLSLSPITSHIIPLFYSLRAFLSWTLSRICNKVLSRRQEILEKSNNVMTILKTFTVGAQLHICIASGSHWPRQEETIFTPGLQCLQTDVITLPIALFCCLFFFNTAKKNTTQNGHFSKEEMGVIGVREGREGSMEKQHDRLIIVTVIDLAWRNPWRSPEGRWTALPLCLTGRRAVVLTEHAKRRYVSKLKRYSTACEISPATPQVVICVRWYRCFLTAN